MQVSSLGSTMFCLLLGKRKVPDSNTAHPLQAWKHCPSMPTARAEDRRCVAGDSEEALAEVLARECPLQLPCNKPKVQGAAVHWHQLLMLPFASSSCFSKN